MISPLEAARAAAAIDLPRELSHTFVILALSFPDVRPPQEQLARMLHVSRSGLNKRLDRLEQLGRIRRVSGQTNRATVYYLNLRESVSPRSPLQSGHQVQQSTSTSETVVDVDLEDGEPNW